MMESAADGINFSDGNQLKRNSDYTTVLFFPPLDEKEILDSMEGKIGEIVTMGFDSEELPWQMIPRKRMQVLDAVRKLAGHVKRNQDVPQNVKFFITFAESCKKFRCVYSGYRNNQIEQGLARQFHQLPSRPTGLRIRLTIPHSKDPKRVKKEATSINVEWDYEDLGYPFNFRMEYRKKGSGDWTGQTIFHPGHF